MVCIQQRRGPRVFEIFSILLALVGVFLITTHGSLTDLAISPAALASGVVSACCVVIYTMWPKKLQQQYPTPMLQGWAFLMGGTMFAMIFRPWTMNYVPTPMGVFGIFTVVVLGNVLAFSLYMSGVPLIGPQKSSLYSFAEPVTAAIISTLVLGSPFTLWDALGFGCIFDAGAVESAERKQSVIDSRGCPQWAAFLLPCRDRICPSLNLPANDRPPLCCGLGMPGPYNAIIK